MLSCIHLGIILHIKLLFAIIISLSVYTYVLPAIPQMKALGNSHSVQAREHESLYGT